jgi:hypothetical protein
MDDDRAALERFRIHEAIGRYVDALNHRDWDAYRKLWVEEGSLFTIFETLPSDEGPTGDSPRIEDVRLYGLPQIMNIVMRYNDISWLFQLPHGIVAELESDTSAIARHSLHIVGQHFTMVGICYDRFTKGDDRSWRFLHRDYRPSYYEAWRPEGVVTRRLPNSDYRRLLEPGSR